MRERTTTKKECPECHSKNIQFLGNWTGGGAISEGGEFYPVRPRPYKYVCSDCGRRFFK